MVELVVVALKLKEEGTANTGGVKVICTLLPLDALLRPAILPVILYVTIVGDAFVFKVKGLECVTDITLLFVLLLQNPMTAICSVVPELLPIAIAPYVN